MLPNAWMAIAAIWAAQICLAAESTTKAHQIESLPGQPKVSFQQYAGYITIDAKQNRALFYYFVEAETDPASKPLVLWLNGGPGCSSVGIGAFCEHGPFKPSRNVLVKNEHSWNKEANMLYLESPAGVGFSYFANKSLTNDEMTARENLAFLQLWLEIFPEYRNRDFYITGESYAGHYAPQLAQLIVESKARCNLKGILIGNPLLEFNNDMNARAEFLWSHGLISDATYDSFTTVCNYSQYFRQILSGSATPVCSAVFKQVAGEISRFVDVYGVTLDVCLSTVASQSRRLLYQVQESDKIDVCVEDETLKYLNRKDVQEALHARLVGVNNWTECSMTLQYETQNLEVPTISLLGLLVKHGVRVFVYSGDQDSIVPLTGTRSLVNGLAKQLGMNTTVPYRVWFEGTQVGGWTQVYGDILSFATIRGASHEAPSSQPKRSLVLFNAFLAGKPLPETAVAARI